MTKKDKDIIDNFARDVLKPYYLTAVEKGIESRSYLESKLRVEIGSAFVNNFFDNNCEIWEYIKFLVDAFFNGNLNLENLEDVDKDSQDKPVKPEPDYKKLWCNLKETISTITFDEIIDFVDMSEDSLDGYINFKKLVINKSYKEAYCYSGKVMIDAIVEFMNLISEDYYG